jgi:catechol 2,3-dioxygenase-like lactoylglutathione lyase family enzyme
MKGTLHHIELYVKNLKQSKEFWGWLLQELGYSIYQQWKDGISYKLKDTYIVFVQVEDKYIKHDYHRKHTGLNHLAFHGGTKAFVDEITTKLKEKNVTILYLDKHPYAGGTDYYAVFFEDPNRIKVEICAD